MTPRLAVERVLDMVTVSADGCWVFTGCRDQWGYGRIGINRDGKWRKTVAHRVTYEHFIGPIPDGLVTDHVACSNTSCVNPWHLELVTPGENSRRNVARDPRDSRGRFAGVR